jgi:uncharacterized protein
MADQNQLREHRATSHPAIVHRQEGKSAVRGYAAVFYNPNTPGTEYKMFDDLWERIDPACFNRALAENQPVRCFVNHDPNMRLGRCDKGTCRLKVDEHGLQYESDLPDTQIGRDTATDLENGNLDGSSFSFQVTGQRWEDMKVEGHMISVRTITDVNLYDVGPVSIPAYNATTAGLRSAESPEGILAQRDAWRNEKLEKEKQATIEADRVAMRAREVELRGIFDESGYRIGNS